MTKKKDNILPEVEVVAKYPHEQRVIDTMNASNAEFMQRLRNNDFRAIHNADGSYSTHVLGNADNIVFPAIQDVNGVLEDYRNLPWYRALDKAIQNKDYIEFPTEGDARYFGEHYKKYFPEFFNHFGDNQYAEGGEIEKPKHWDELSMVDKSDVMAAAIKNGVTTLEEIRKAWDDYADNGYREDSSYRDSSKDIENTLDGYDDAYQEEAHEYLKGGYKPSASIKNRIANWEGSSMQTNRSFDAEAKDFWNAIPSNVRSKLSQQQADALYSYSYNVGAGNFKKRVVPSLERYFNGNGSVEDVQRHMYATKDKDYRGLAKRRAVERAMFGGQRVEDVSSFDYDYSSNSSPYGHKFTVNNNFQTAGYLGPIVNGNSVNNDNTNKTNIFLQALEDEPKQTIAESTPEPRYNALERLQNIYSMYGMDDYAQEIGKYNPFEGLMFAEGGKKASIYKTNNGEYTTASGHPVEQIGWDDNGYARYRDTVTGDLGKAYEPTDDYGITAKRVLNDLTPEQKADMLLKNYTLAQAVKDNQTASNDNLWIENGREQNPNLDYKGIVGGRANAAWEQEHPAMADWMYIANVTPFVVAGYPFAAGASDAVMGTTAGQAISGPLVDMAMQIGRSKWMPWADAVATSIFGAEGINDVRNGNVTPETVLELAPLTRVGKGIAQGAKDVSKAAYNLYDNGTIWDRYTTFRGRFGNYSDNPFVNAYATYARRYGLPDKARIPADVIRKLRMQNGEILPTNDKGVVNFTGYKSWNNNPHINVTTDRGVTSHKSGWDGADTYVFSTQDFLNQTMPNGSLKSIEPSDMFANGSDVFEYPKKVTLVSGDKAALKKAKAAGMQTLSSPKLRRMFNKENTRSFLFKNPKTVKHWPEYANEINRLIAQRGTPTLSDYNLLESITGLKSGVAPLSEYTNAINSLNRMVYANTSDIMNGSVKQYVYPNGRIVDWSDALRQLNLVTRSPYNNVFYDPATFAEFNWRSTQ